MCMSILLIFNYIPPPLPYLLFEKLAEVVAFSGFLGANKKIGGGTAPHFSHISPRRPGVKYII
jgi:hypothetical protein